MLKKAWVIIILMLLFGGLLAGYKYLSDKKEADALADEEIEAGFDLIERNKVENAILHYETMENYQRYLNTAPLMTVDATKENQTIVEYTLELKGQDRLTSTGIIENTNLQLLRAYISENIIMGDLDKIDQEYTKQPYLKELIWCNNTGSGAFTLGVIETKTFPNLSSDARKLVETYMDQLMKDEPRLNIRAVKEYTIQVYDGTTDANQKNTYNGIASSRNSFMNAYNGFTPAQQEYFRRRTGYQPENEEEESTGTGFSLKFFIVGLMGGCFAGICLCFIMLYLSLKNAAPEDYSDNLGLRNLGLISVNGKKHPYRDFLAKKELKAYLFDSGEESVAYAGVRLGTYCQKHELKEVAVLCSESREIVEKAAEALKKELKKSDVELHMTEKVGTDSEALKRLISTGNCILMEELYGGNRQKSSELLQFCRENEVDVIGGIGVVELTL